MSKETIFMNDLIEACGLSDDETVVIFKDEILKNHYSIRYSKATYQVERTFSETIFKDFGLNELKIVVSEMRKEVEKCNGSKEI